MEVPKFCTSGIIDIYTNDFLPLSYPANQDGGIDPLGEGWEGVTRLKTCVLFIFLSVILTFKIFFIDLLRTINIIEKNRLILIA